MHELLCFDRLEQVAKCSVFERAYSRLHGRRRGDQNHRNVEIPRSNVAQQIHSTHARQRDIAQEHVEPLSQKHLETIFRTRGSGHLIAPISQDPPIQTQRCLVVVDHEHARWLLRCGVRCTSLCCVSFCCSWLCWISLRCTSVRWFSLRGTPRRSWYVVHAQPMAYGRRQVFIMPFGTTPL